MSQFKSHKGSALILVLIFVLVFSALGVALCSMSGTNLQIASNHKKVNRAFANSESGVEIMRYWLSRVLVPASTSPSNYLSTIINMLQSDLAANNASNLTFSSDGTIAPVMLEATNNRTFEGQIQILPGNPYILQAFATGSFNDITRTIRVDYNVEPYEYPIFKFGLATKGPLNFLGNPTIIAANDNWEADIYIESTGSNVALSVSGNTNFDGNISIGNPDSTVDLQNDISIAGDQGQEAIDNHVFIGVEPPDFPAPDSGYFRQYATGDIIDSATDLSGGMTLTNATILAGTNPHFDGSVTIEGVLFIEQPNQVTFGSNVNLQGIIVADGDVQNPGTNNISFLGNFSTAPIPQDSQFDTMRHETGASIIAPGFKAIFAGNFSSMDGVMAVSGVHFSGNVNALIKGTILSYSDSPVVIEGNATLTFDRSSTTTIPAGFDTYRELHYNPGSYSVVY